jgi:hypothetical protein
MANGAGLQSRTILTRGSAILQLLVGFTQTWLGLVRVCGCGRNVMQCF